MTSVISTAAAACVGAARRERKRKLRRIVFILGSFNREHGTEFVFGKRCGLWRSLTLRRLGVERPWRNIHNRVFEVGSMLRHLDTRKRLTQVCRTFQRRFGWLRTRGTFLSRTSVGTRFACCSGMFMSDVFCHDFCFGMPDFRRAMSGRGRGVRSKSLARRTALGAGREIRGLLRSRPRRSCVFPFHLRRWWRRSIKLVPFFQCLFYLNARCAILLAGIFYNTVGKVLWRRGKGRDRRCSKRRRADA